MLTNNESLAAHVQSLVHSSRTAKMWLSGVMCLTTYKHLQSIIIYNKGAYSQLGNHQKFIRYRNINQVRIEFPNQAMIEFQWGCNH